MLVNEKLPCQVQEFSAENCSNGSLAKFAKFHTNPYNFVACLVLWLVLKSYHFAIFCLYTLGKDTQI